MRAEHAGQRVHVGAAHFRKKVRAVAAQERHQSTIPAQQVSARVCSIARYLEQDQLPGRRITDQDQYQCCIIMMLGCVRLVSD